MKLPTPLHIGPDPADEVSGWGVAQQVIFRFNMGGQSGFIQVQQRSCQRYGIRCGFRTVWVIFSGVLKSWDFRYRSSSG